MHRQASFYAAQWPKGTNVARGRRRVRVLPAADRPEQRQAGRGRRRVRCGLQRQPGCSPFQTYLSVAEWANAKAKATPAGGWISANKGLAIGNLTSPIDMLSVQLLTQEGAVVRFDGSDLMPAKVGAGTFWKGMVNWVTGQDTQTTLDQIEASWPK